jgi:hypothetical protein
MDEQMKTTEEQDEQYLQEQRESMKRYVETLVNQRLRPSVDLRTATDEEQPQALQEEVQRRRDRQMMEEQTPAIGWSEASRQIAEMKEAAESYLPTPNLEMTPVYAAPFPQDPDVPQGTSSSGTGPDDWHEPDVTTKPVPGTDGRVNRTLRHTNLPGGVLMDTRSFEKWVLDNFVPLQDQTAALMERCGKVLESMNVTLSRLGRVEQQIKELKRCK